jgi:hypothetical protein
VIEQEHRESARCAGFETAAVTIQGIELAEKSKKQQFNLKLLTGKASTAPDMLGRCPVRL